MRTYLIDKKGKIKQTEVDRPSILKMFGVHGRDLRPIVSQRQIATVFRRNKAIIININDIKLILDKDQALLFCASQYKEEKIVEFFQQKMKEYEGKLRFELYLMDKAFYYMFKQGREQFESISRQSQITIKRLSERPTDEHLEKLLSLKKRLGKLEGQVEEYEKILAEFLEDDDELADLIFVNKPTEKQLNETESVIENLTEQAEQINQSIDELSENLDDSQEILSLKIANKRNTIIRFDLIVSFVAATFGFMAVVVGLYGMNLKNHLEIDQSAFFLVGIGLLIFLFISVMGMWVYFRKNKIL